MATNDIQQFASIRVVGGLISTPVLQALREYKKLEGQSPSDYGIDKGLKINDELSRYWRIAQTRWQEFQREDQRADMNRNKLACDSWLLPLLTRVLGYEVQSSQPQQLGERLFPISHTAHQGLLPLLLCGSQYPLDKGDPLFGQDGHKRSPTGMMQEYLNAEDRCIWALVSNGTHLRLLRDNLALTRPAYIEVDFARLFDEDNYADFATFWLLLHQSRTAPRDGQVANCWLESWRAKGLDEGERALANLRYGVADALRLLGTGFISHTANQKLRDKISSNSLTTDAYFQQILRLVYRCLFLFTAEDRDLALLPVEYEGCSYKVERHLYERGYSLAGLRDKARLRRHHDECHDAWEQLLITFAGFATGQPALAQPGLGGLFSHEQCPDLEDCQLDNRYLYGALWKLAYFEQNRTLIRINYRDMDTEEFGSVYESLLELIPQLVTQGRWSFRFLGDADDESTASGHTRKLTSSYYTPDSLVQELLKSALEPVLERRLKDNPQHPREALLALTVCDPACGSGHFLLAAARRLAASLAQLTAGGDQATEQHYRHALREVVSHSIYGVDKNPLAVELCKTALWLEALEPGRPLGFLDAHIQCGNSLVGVFDPVILENGIPDKAYDAQTGDDKDTCKDLKTQNRGAVEKMAVALRMEVIDLSRVEAMPEEELVQVESKRQAWLASQASVALQNARLKEDLYTAAFFLPKTPASAELVPTNKHLKLVAGGGILESQMLESVQAVARLKRFFHWHLAFPQVFVERGGFDVLLGNPPWDQLQFDPQEFFSSRAPEIANAQHMAARSRLIAALELSSPWLYEDYLRAQDDVLRTQVFVHESGRYPFTSHGRINLAPLFSEFFSSSISKRGRAGFIVPSGIATDSFTQQFFRHLTKRHMLASLFDFENKEALFKGVHRSYKFCLMTIGNNLPATELQFFCSKVVHIQERERRFILDANDFLLLNPNTQTCPVFRSKRDAELTKKIYKRSNILLKELIDEEGKIVTSENPWGIKFQLMFMMNNASEIILMHKELLAKNALIKGGAWLLGADEFIPFYEGKMVHQYDHRWASYEIDGEASSDCTLAEKHDPRFFSRPRYWVDRWEVVLRTTRAPEAVVKATKQKDKEALNLTLRMWAAGHAIQQEQYQLAGVFLAESIKLATSSWDLFTDDLSPIASDALELAKTYPLNIAEYMELCSVLSEESKGVQGWIRKTLNARCPAYFLGWRDICRSTDERTMIASVIPFCGVANTFPIMISQLPVGQLVALLGNLNSLAYDYIVRQKIGGIHVTFNYVKQFPTLMPSQYSDEDIDFIRPRVLQLSYTALDLKPFALDLGFSGDPFPFDPERRHQLQSELDAYYARLYGLTRDEMRYILDPVDIMGEDYPSETFRVLKKNEMAQFQEYRTRRLVLEAWDKLEKGELQ